MEDSCWDEEKEESFAKKYPEIAEIAYRNMSRSLITSGLGWSVVFVK